MASRIIIGESGGPTPVIDWEVAGAMDAAQKAGVEIYGMINGLEGLLNANIKGNIVDLSHMDPMSFVFNGPGAGLKTTRIKPKEPEYKKIAENLAALGVDGVIYIGGNDSADQRKGDKVIQGLDIAPVVVYQVMGRKAGWLAQGTAFARVDPKGDMVPDRAPHVILCKEVPFDKQAFLDRLDEVITRLGQAVVVVQEDLTDKESGKSIAEVYATEVVYDSHGNIQHGRATSFSPAVFLAELIGAELKIEAVPGKVKDCVLNPQHIQRSCMMSHVDASEAYKVGFASVQAMLDGESKKSVVLQRGRGATQTALTDLENIAAKDRKVPAEYIQGIDGPTQDFIDEFIYVIGGPVALPHYSKMDFMCVAVADSIRQSPYVRG